MRLVVINSLALLGGIAIFSLLGFAEKKQQRTTCWKLEIQIEGENTPPFITEKQVHDLALSATDSIIGKKTSSIDIASIHKKLSDNTTVKEARVFTTIDGRCVIQIKERTPIARILNEDGSSFYLDTQGYTMATSPYSTAKVPVFTGAIQEKMQPQSVMDISGNEVQSSKTLLDDIFTLTQFIRNNEFWKAQVEHVYINTRHEFEIIPRVGNHRLQIGDITNLEMKFKKLLTFYANTLYTQDLNQYSSINVEYDGQVVCVKKAY